MLNDYIVKEEGGDTRKAIMISGMEITYDEVNDKYDELIEANKEEMDAAGMQALAAEIGGNPPEIPTGNNDDDDENQEGEAVLSDYLVTYDGIVSFYSIERMQDPKQQLDQQDGLAS